MELISLFCTAEPFLSSSIQHDAHETLINIRHVLYNITVYNQVDDLHLSQPFTQPSSQLATSEVYKTFYGSFTITHICTFYKTITVFIDHVMQLDISLTGNVEKVLKLHFETKYCVSCSCDSPRNSSTSIWQQTPITIVKVNLFKQLSRGRPQNDKFIVCCRDTLTFQSYFCRTIWHHVSYQQ